MSHPDAERVASNESTARAIVSHHAQLSTGLVQRVEMLLDLVENDHTRGAEAARRELRSYLRREVLPHARAEEAVLYPAAATEVTPAEQPSGCGCGNCACGGDGPATLNVEARTDERVRA